MELIEAVYERRVKTLNAAFPEERDGEGIKFLLCATLA